MKPLDLSNESRKKSESMVPKPASASSKCCDQTHEEDSGVSGDSQIDSPKNKATTPCKFSKFYTFETYQSRHQFYSENAAYKLCHKEEGLASLRP